MRRAVLVTGASGFVGSRTLAPLRAAGFEVHSFGRRKPPHPDVVHHAGDLFDRERVRSALAAASPTHVLHCAWNVAHGVFWHSPENLDWVAATLLLGHDALEAGATHFVGIGTCVEYDWSDGGPRPRQEADPLAPKTLYGLAKSSTHHLLAKALETGGVRLAWARLFHLFGEGEPPERLVPSLARALLRGEPAVCRHGQLVRDFMPIEEAGKAIAALVASDVAGPVNIASGTGLSLGEIAQEIARILGRTDLMVVESNPAPHEPATMIADVSRLANEVRFTPDRDWKQALTQAVAKA